MRLFVPFGSPAQLQTSWMLFLLSAKITSLSCPIISGCKCLTSFTSLRPSLKSLITQMFHQKRLILLNWQQNFIINYLFCKISISKLEERIEILKIEILIVVDKNMVVINTSQNRVLHFFIFVITFHANIISSKRHNSIFACP